MEKQTYYKVGDVEVYWLSHASFKIKTPSKVVYIDPFHVPSQPKDADLILVSHSHYDHLDPQSIENLCCENTIIVASKDCQQSIDLQFKAPVIRPMVPYEEISVKGCLIKTYPAYNLEKPFHPKVNQWLGFWIKIDGVEIYFLGDTDPIEEIQHVPCDIALIPVSGIYVMDAEQAAVVASQIKPKKVAIPMHWGTLVDDKGQQVGTLKDAEEFCSKYPGHSVILDPT